MTSNLLCTDGDDDEGGASIEEYLTITDEQNILINWYAATNPGYGIYTAYNKQQRRPKINQQ